MVKLTSRKIDILKAIRIGLEHSNNIINMNERKISEKDKLSIIAMLIFSKIEIFFEK